MVVVGGVEIQLCLEWAVLLHCKSMVLEMYAMVQFVIGKEVVVVLLLFFGRVKACTAG